MVVMMVERERERERERESVFVDDMVGERERDIMVVRFYSCY